MSVWDSLVGQQPAIEVLSRAVADQRSMTHAWLITGPPGSGRSVAARAFAAALQCDQQPAGCGSCHACTTSMQGKHPDVTVVATEKVTISIAEVRSLVALAQRSPAAGKWRVIIVEDADRMMESTSNVLLKAIEEPPARTVWILCAPSPLDVITTIRSRCRGLSLRVPPVDDVAALLVHRDGVDPEVAAVAARAAQCHVGMARHLARDPEAREQRRRLVTGPATVRNVADCVVAANELVELATNQAKERAEERNQAEKAELLRTLGAEEGGRLTPAVRAQVRQLEEDQKRRQTRMQRDTLDRVLVDLLSLYRDVYCAQVGAGVELVNADLADLVRQLAQESDPRRTLFRIDAVNQARQRIAANVAPQLAVEAMAVNLRPLAQLA